MDGNHRIERIAYSNIGIKEIKAGYQVVGKTSGITRSDEEGFTNAISNVDKVDSRSGYAEALIEVGGSMYFTNISMTTDANDRACPISSAIAADGVKWRELMRNPENLIFCSREFFLEVSPSDAAPGSPSELNEIKELKPVRGIPELSSLREQFNLDDEKYSELISCVYYCLAARSNERMLIVLPENMLMVYIITPKSHPVSGGFSFI